MESAGDRVQVYCRVRPHVDQGDALQRRCVSVSREHAQIVLHSASDDKAFTFDHAGDEHTSQEDVFRAVGMPITEACMAGYNTTIFAYGQTGAGKTYTILGPDTPAHAEGADGVPADDAGCAMHEQAGLTPRVLAYIFAQIARIERTSEGGASFLCKCSYLEIYNENLTDLLVVDPSASPLPPRLRENLHRGIYVESLETVDVRTPAEALAVLAVGATHRRVAATSMNKESSRSHAVFTLTIESQTIAPSGLKSTRSSQFNLVDLAGSERQRDTGATGQRLTEACNINKSLSALGFARVVCGRLCPHLAPCLRPPCASRVPRSHASNRGEVVVRAAAMCRFRAQQRDHGARHVGERARAPRAIPRLEAHVASQGFARRERTHGDHCEHLAARAHVRRDALDAQVCAARQDDPEQRRRERGVDGRPRGAPV